MCLVKMKRKISIILTISLFLISSISHITPIESNHSTEMSSTQQNTGLLQLEDHRVLDINIVLYNYAHDQIFLDSLDSQLRHIIEVKIDSNTMYTYKVNFNYIFLHLK